MFFCCAVGEREERAIEERVFFNLTLCCNDNSSLPKELVELSALTKLDLSENKNLGTRLPAHEAFPAELEKIKSLRELKLLGPLLRAVPPFVLEQKSLESLSLSRAPRSPLPPSPGRPVPGRARGAQVPAGARPRQLRHRPGLRRPGSSRSGPSPHPARARRGPLLPAPRLPLVGGCSPDLSRVTLFDPFGWDRGSMAHINAFGAKLKKKSPRAKVSPWERREEELFLFSFFEEFFFFFKESFTQEFSLPFAFCFAFCFAFLFFSCLAE